MLKLFIILNLFYLYKSIGIRINQHPQSQIVVPGSSVKLSCEYTSEDSHVTIQWLFKGINLNQFGPVHSTDTIRVSRNTLKILSFDAKRHSGEYKCLVNGSNMAMLSRPGNLSAAILNEFDTTSDNHNQIVSVSVGNVAIVMCNLPYSNPSAVPVFYFNDQLLPVSTDNRYKIFSSSGNLQIFNVRQSDSGVYRCSAKNPLTNQLTDSSKRTTLKVYEPIGTKLPDIVYVPTETSRIKVGDNLTLECVANGAPVPLVSWEKFGGTLPDKRSVQIFGNLVITNVQIEDKGTYVCRAENGPGQATFKTAMLDVQQAPFVQTKEKFVYTIKPRTRSDQRIDIKCPIESTLSSPIEYEWYFNGFNLPATSSNHRITMNSEHRSVLSLRESSSQAAGVYQCLAKSDIGLVQADLIVQLDEDETGTKAKTNRPEIIMGPQNTTIYEGQSVVLLCVTSETSSGNVQINWLQNDLIIEPTLMRRFEINQLLGNLRIVSVQKSDAGLYRCIASNQFGVSSGEAYVNVKSIEDERRQVKDDSVTISSRPSIHQIGSDKILLKWHLLNADTMRSIEHDHVDNQVAYFKVEYKTTNRHRQHMIADTWLTIDEQIDGRKREYILTDLAYNEVYRFRLNTFYVNGKMSYGQASAKFRINQSWQANGHETTSKMHQEKTLSSSSSSWFSASSEFKLKQIQVQIEQIWAVSSTSLGLKWNILIDNQNENDDFKIEKKNISLYLSKINGFYIYYRKIDQKTVKTKSNLDKNKINQNENYLHRVDSVPNVPLYNYTRINVPLIENQSIDSYLIANLDQSAQYEIKMTCYNLNGDLCSFSNSIYGLTLTPMDTNANNFKIKQHEQQQQHHQELLAKSKHSEILFMILGAVLAVLSLLLTGFVFMCVMRNRQHKKLLAQLHTSHKLASSSCPTLIYEDSLRQNNRVNMYIAANNDSNSTNSQSMSTTTSSITTPPTAEHMLLLNGNTVPANSFVGMHPPPIPQVPPPQPGPNATINRININMNPLNGYLEAKNHTENFYHTLTQLGNLPDKNDVAYTTNEYNNATINMRNLIIKQQQQQQQQLLMNTLKNLNIQYQISDSKVRSPSVKRSSSKKNKKNKNIDKNEITAHQQIQLQLQHQQHQQQQHYYLMPNCMPNCLPAQPIVYNDLDLINAAFLNQNLLLLNNQHQNQVSSPFQSVNSPTAVNQNTSNLMDLFDKANEEIASDLNEAKKDKIGTYEQQNECNNEENEPMLTNHYATTEIKSVEEQSQLL